MESFDLIVIGAGPGGYVAAIRAGQLGLKTAIIEKRKALGGTCLNIGCIPSKALLESSHHFHQTKHGLAAHGITVGEISMDITEMLRRKDKIVTDLTAGIGLLMKKNKVAVYSGATGRLSGPGTVSVEQDGKKLELQTKAVVLATGSDAVELPFLPFDGKQVVSSTEALAFESVPERLAVVGAGAVGLELGSVWARLGAKVTVLEMMDAILPFADRQTAQIVQRSLKTLGFDFQLGAKVTGAESGPEGLTLAFTDKKGKEQQLVCDKALVAVGRKPYTDGLGLETLDIRPEANGKISVNERFETSAPGVYAIGDLIDGPMLAHKAEDEGIAVAEILSGLPGHVDPETIPNVVYTWPELAQVGLTEDAAKEQGHPVKVGKYFYKSNGRAKSMEESEGLVKIVAHAESDRILGVHIVGAHASELIAEAVVAMEYRASSEDLARTAHAHPTLSEIVREAAMAVDKRAIHG